VRDGQGRTLRYATARLQNSGAVPEWEEQEAVPLDVVSTPTDLDDWVAMLLRKHEASPASGPPSRTGR
jgi:hypothetical protein